MGDRTSTTSRSSTGPTNPPPPRCANAGHPPALLFNGGQAIRLASQSPPVGIFGDTAFSTSTVLVPPGSQILIYSDGVYESQLGEGRWWSHEKFVDLCTHLAGSPDWSLDDTIDDSRRRSSIGTFGDDYCLVRLNFD